MNITIMQSTIPIDKFGRVIAFFGSLMSFVLLIGYLISGPLAAWMGIVPLYVISSSLGIFMLISLYFFSSVRQLDKINSASSKEEDEALFPIESSITVEIQEERNISASDDVKMHL